MGPGCVRPLCSHNPHADPVTLNWKAGIWCQSGYTWNSPYLGSARLRPSSAVADGVPASNAQNSLVPVSCMFTSLQLVSGVIEAARCVVCVAGALTLPSLARG
jgi:hypothetical protein